MTERTVVSRVGALARKPISGPFWLGLLVGGLPCGVVLSRLPGREFSPELLRYLLFLTPVALLVAILGTLAGVDSRALYLARRALLTALSACLPLPLMVLTTLGFQGRGLDVFAPENFLGVLLILGMWAFAVALPAWLVGLVFNIADKRRAGGSSFGGWQ
jgi:hypothetical protein